MKSLRPSTLSLFPSIQSHLWIIFFLITFLCSGIAQGVVYEYGNLEDEFFSIYRLIDGNYAVCGQRGGHNESEIWLMKVNSGGEVLLNTIINPFEHISKGSDIIEVEGGGFLIGGHFNSIGPPLEARRFYGVRTDGDGEEMWANILEPEGLSGDNAGCNDVIELKSGDFVLAGFAMSVRNEDRDWSYKGWMTRVTREGEVIWDHGYYGNDWVNGDNIWEDRCKIFAIRESENYIIGCGEVYHRGAWIFGASKRDGDIVWEHFTNWSPDSMRNTYDGMYGTYSALVSYEGDYYAFGDYFQNVQTPRHVTYPMTRFTQEGEIIEQRLLETGVPLYAWGTWRDPMVSAKAHPDGGFVLAIANYWPELEDQDGPLTAAIVRISENGDYLWHEEHEWFKFHSLVVSREDGIIVAGQGCGRVHAYEGGILLKTSGSTFLNLAAGHNEETDYGEGIGQGEDDNPNRRHFEIEVLQGDSVRFWVQADNRLEDEINFEWFLDDDEISRDSSVTINFDELGRFEVICRLSTEVDADSFFWGVNVVELMITQKSPVETNLHIRRGRDVTFSLEVAAIVGDPLNYLWTLTNINTGQQEEVGTDSSVTIEFVRSSDYEMDVMAYRNQSSDWEAWNIIVRGLILSYLPEENNLVVTPGDSVEFTAFAFNPGADSLRYTWFVNQDITSVDSLVTVIFDEEGEYLVRVVLTDGVEVDSVDWVVTSVQPGGIGETESPFLADETVLYPPVPNPFNSTVSINFHLPTSAVVSLSIFDLAGREVVRLVDGELPGGDQTLIWNAGNAPTGVYIAVIKTGDTEKSTRLVLMR